ncbi:phospho-sugar mutase [Pseudogracilibacillus auburnensis]|uniref:Phosphoglucomutase n=1 Tax=Pseudogracilibacillus auburnensis TaxID=1494959 RepID=A0A2V3W598_9BACI|nr:alpha-phosphoglucomutase [Pseudogracilibacillus auburnensis]
MVNWEDAFRKWVDAKNLDPILKQQLIEMKSNKNELQDAFYEQLTFGTGGMRGVLGPGINRMNIYTIRKAVKGLAFYLEENRVNYRDRGVVIAYDSRYMSKEFAIEAAKVLGVHGIKAYVFEEIKPTPLLSFAVRYLGTVAGIMITASHNPPEYNGFKVYNEEGSQISLDEANEIIHHIQQVEDELHIEVLTEKHLVENNLLEWMNGEVDHAYLEQLIKISKMDEQALLAEKELKIVLTPLHGTGLPLVRNGLKQLQFKHIHVVDEQAIPDPEFSTVQSPNPEEKQAFKEAIKLGDEIDADILLATDPDADRLGVAVKNNENKYVILTGNQLGSLMLDYLLMHTNKHVLKNARMIKTIVTTELGRSIANEYGVKTIDTLTGFKYIGEKINEFDATGETFIFGYEESYGYLISSFTRDKDAVQAAVMACEMAEFWKNKGMTLVDALEKLYKKHGYFKEGLDALTLNGLEGQEKIASIVNDFRHNEQQAYGNMKTIYVEDYLQSTRIYKNGQNKMEKVYLPKENVVKYILEDQCWICLRPSGTEPKVKWYYGAYGKTEKEVDERLSTLEKSLQEIIVQPLHLT